MELNHLTIIDWEAGVKLAGNKQDLADEMLSLFIERLPNDISTIKQLYTTKNYFSLQQQIHKLHSILCYLGLPRLKTLISHLEKELKNNIMGSLPSLFNQLDTEINLLLEHYPAKTM